MSLTASTIDRFPIADCRLSNFGRAWKRTEFPFCTRKNHRAVFPRASVSSLVNNYGFRMNLEQLTRELDQFFAGSTEAVVLEDGAVTFDLREARYSVSEQHGKVLLHLWSAERNVVRRVLDAERGKDSLHLTVLRFGQAHAVTLEIARSRDRRTPAAKQTARAQYRSLLLRLVEREFPTHRMDRLTSSPDLERSFGPVYARGVLRKGNAVTAVLGVGAGELQSSVDGSLTFGLLWLDHLRQNGGKHFVESLTLFVPAGHSEVVRARMAHLARPLWERRWLVRFLSRVP